MSVCHEIRFSFGCFFDGKRRSSWDIFTEIPGKTFQSSNGDITVDHYHRYKEDVALMAEAGLKAYRFSVSWARVYAAGKGAVNEGGLKFYVNLIDELLSAGIVPIVTLYHWDVPEQLMQAYVAWDSREMIEDFNHYLCTLFERFGQKVKYWITLNEQNIHFNLGYVKAMHPPGVKS